MSKTISAALFGLALAFAGPAAAATVSYAFNVQNASGGPLAVFVDGKSACLMAAGGTCTVVVPEGDSHRYTYVLGDGPQVAFSTGDLTLTDTCKIDAAGAHCIDAQGGSTN